MSSLARAVGSRLTKMRKQQAENKRLATLRDNALLHKRAMVFFSFRSDSRGERMWLVRSIGRLICQ